MKFGTLKRHFLPFEGTFELPKGPRKTIQYRSYKHYSKESFLADLRNENWDSIEESEDVNEAASIWSKMFLNVADRHAPVKQTRIKGTLETSTCC